MGDFLIKRPMLLAALLASAISIVGIYIESALFLIFVLLPIVFFILVYKKAKGEIIVCFAVVFAVVLSLVFTTRSVTELEKFDGCDCAGEFVVLEEPVNHGDYYSVNIETIYSETLKSGTKLNAVFYKGELEVSQKIKANIFVEGMKNYKLKYSFYSSGIYLKGRIKSFEYIGEREFVLHKLDGFKNYIKETIFEFYGKRESATMLALLSGDRSYFSNQFYANVKNSGVAHVMVVSGMHLSIIVSLFLYLINKVLYNRYLKAVVIFAATLLVAAVCGFTMSILRAGITYLFLALSLVLKRENTPENTLGCAVCTVLIMNPFAIMNVAFQLSVLSTFAILVVAVPISLYIEERKLIKNRFILTIIVAVITSLSALIFTAPTTTYIFGYISNVSVITNLLITFAVTFGLILCILGLLIPFLRPILFGLSNLAISYINWVIDYFGNLSFSTTDTSKIVSLFMVVVIIAILWILVACKKHKDVLKLKEIRAKKHKERGVKGKCR